MLHDAVPDKSVSEESVSEKSVPLRKPPRYLRKEKCVAAWHNWWLETHAGEYPTLKDLSHACGIPPTTVFQYCRVLKLPLSQCRPRSASKAI